MCYRNNLYDFYLKKPPVGHGGIYLNPNTWETEKMDVSEFPAYLVYILYPRLVEESHNNSGENTYVFIQISNTKFFRFLSELILN